MKKVYQTPLYYEIAFSFMDIKKQIDCFERIIDKFSKIKAKRFLDIACGPSLQLREIARRGYEAVGLDLSGEMLNYLKKEAKKENLSIETIKSSMYRFKLKKKADFAFIMLGSLTPGSNKEFLKHLDSVADSLNKGGLYLIQNHMFDISGIEKPLSWTEKRGKISVKTTYVGKIKNVLDQSLREYISLDVNDNGRKRSYSHFKDFKYISPQEFKLLVEKSKFEFVGWYPGDCNEWHLNRKLEKEKDVNMNIVLLRRK